MLMLGCKGFSIFKYPYVIKQNCYENTKTYQVEVVYLNLTVNLQGNVCQLEGRINFQMLRVKGVLK